MGELHTCHCLINTAPQAVRVEDSSNISCHVGLLVMKSFSICMLVNVILHLQF